MFDDWYWGDFEEDIRTAEERDKNSAATYFLEQASDGDPEGKFMYGLCCLYGVGSEINAEEALSWLTEAAEDGLSKAQFVIGNIYATGAGPAGKLSEKERAAEAKKWFLLAAEAGLADAQWELGFRLKCGDVLEKDDKESLKWVRKAAENGNPPAQRALYFEYRLLASLGRDLPDDDVSVEDISVENVSVEDISDESVSVGDVSDKNVSGKDISGEIVSGKDVSETDPDDDPAGDGKPELLKKAVSWLEKSASSGFPPALKDLGDVYSNGLGEIAPDPKKAFRYYRKAAKRGFVPAYTKLADCYMSGCGTRKNGSKAFEYFMKAAAEGDRDGDSGVAACYYMGTGVQKNETAALVWAKSSAEDGNIRSMITAGMFYEAGVAGMGTDYEKAGTYFRRAVREGFEPAAKYLENMKRSAREKA